VTVPSSAIELCSGAFLDLANPQAADITLADVARGLSRTCRFAGHTRVFYSVAEHARLVAAHLEARGASLEAQLCGLHHDDHEAFLGDVTRPLKAMLPEYRTISDRMQTAIEEALELPSAARLGVDREVAAADNWALAAEAFHLLPSRGRSWPIAHLYDSLVDQHGAIGCADPHDVEAALFVRRHWALVDSIGRRPAG
jgi:hypothetical protein